MRLPPAETEQLFRLLSAVNNFIYGKLQEVKGQAATRAFRELPLPQQLEVREAFVADHSFIDQFIVENPAQLSFAELELVGEWRNMITGDFFLVKYLKKYTVFLDFEEPATAYGVVGLTQEIEEIVGAALPVMVSDLILLPFHGKLIYDGLFRGNPIQISPSLRRVVNDDYREARVRGIVDSLRPTSEFTQPKVPAAKRAPQKSSKPRTKSTQA